VARVTDQDNDPAGAAEPGGVDTCAETPAGAAGETGEVRVEIQIGGLDEAAGQEATGAVARYEVSG
jgi:hypothetical protein